MNSNHGESTIQNAGTVNSDITQLENDKQFGLHAHWDCFSGAAGDMMLAACLDAADFEDNNRTAVATVPTKSMMASNKLLQRIEDSIKNGLPQLAAEFSIECKRVWRGSGSIAAMHVNVNSIYKHQPVSVPPPAAPFEVTPSQDNSSSHSDDSHHNHDHSHDHSHHHDHNLDHRTADNSNVHHHSHDHTSNDPPVVRNLPEIRQMLMLSPELYIPKWVRDHAIAAFTELAKAEAAVHGASSMNDVHFHEVGAVDSIVDTVGTLLALHFLNVTSVSCSRLPLGEGMVSTAHGILPVPAPATLRLMAGMSVASGPPGRTGELVTPTAASLLRVLVTNQPHHDGRSPNMTLLQIGVGAGTKDFVNHPNIIRLLIGQRCDDPRSTKL